MEDVDAERNRLLDNWEAAAPGWGRQADRTSQSALPVSNWMVEHVDPQPGERVLELAAGPGDTGFLAARRIGPSGLLICSDGTEGMLAVARERAREQGIANVEFKQLQLEWIDLPTADVDVVLCRWGVMLTLDPAAALQECRRVLKPGGRFAIAVWDQPEKNPWTVVMQQSLVALGFAEPPAPGGPGMFAMAQPGRLQQMLEDAGFVEITVEQVRITRRYGSVLDWIGETRDLSRMFATVWDRLGDDDRHRVVAEITERSRPFADAEGVLELDGSCLAAIAHA